MTAVVSITFIVFAVLIYVYYLMIYRYSQKAVGKKFSKAWSSKLYQVQSAIFMSLATTALLLYLAKYFGFVTF